jgi:hypothetical protein
LGRLQAWIEPGGAVEYELHIEAFADEPLIDTSARDDAVMVGSPLMGDVASPLIEAHANLKPLVTQGILAHRA